MPLFILLCFIALPLLEIALFIQVGDEIGITATVALTLLTAVAGTFMVRAQGLATLNKVRASLDGGEMPVRPVFDGACLLIAGAFLLAPGFITDVFGLLLLMPWVRAILLLWLASKVSVTTVVSGVRSDGGTPRQRYDVEGDYQDITPSETPALTDDKESKPRPSNEQGRNIG